MTPDQATIMRLILWFSIFVLVFCNPFAQSSQECLHAFKCFPDHITHLFKTLQWLLIVMRIKLKILNVALRSYGIWSLLISTTVMLTLYAKSI